MNIPREFLPNNIKDWLEMALKIILIIGGILAAVQYFSVKQDNRVRETLEQVKAFNKGPILDAKLKLHQVWTPYHSQIEMLKKRRVASENVKYYYLNTQQYHRAQ